jgi:hypothetical protein
MWCLSLPQQRGYSLSESIRIRSKGSFKVLLKNHIQVLGYANVGNHLHLHLRLAHPRGWRPFVRAVTSAIRIAVAGHPRWQTSGQQIKRFWDYRPYTVLIQAYEHFRNQARYILINQLQGDGYPRPFAQAIVDCGGRKFLSG